MRRVLFLLTSMLASAMCLSAQPVFGSQIPGTGSEIPAVAGVSAVLEQVRGPEVGLPVIPENELRFYSARYRWTLPFEDGGDVEARVYTATDPAGILIEFSRESEVCAGNGYRTAVFADSVLVCARIAETDEWVVFEFPDRDLPVCVFIDEFLELYGFFRRAVGNGAYPPFPGVVGSLPE